jgi:WD40 repeat protein/transcriptional regulator with XRE-family HTH domain
MAGEPTPPATEPDPGRASTAEELGRELTLLRERAGLTVREAAGKAGVPISTAGDYFTGRHLPSPSQAETLRKLVLSCGTTAHGAESWVEALGRVRRAPGRRPAGSPVPYKGLAPFESEDAEWFFARDELIDMLINVAERGRSGSLVTVTGASGSGKSSLLRAGLIARLTRGADSAGMRWHVVLLTPGSVPTAALAAQLEPLAEPLPAQSHLAVVVDQFEEVFTVCRDEFDRQKFIAALSELSAHALVVLGLRADFYGYALQYSELASSLQYHQVLVGPMTQGQLRDAITQPARKAKFSLDPGLADLILADLAPRWDADEPDEAWHEPGTLPLLSHALRATWERARGGRLTVADYQATGGIRNAVACTAEAVYAALAEPDKDLARRLFLSLVRVSEEGPLGRAKVPLAELPDRAADEGAARDVLDNFVSQRLVTIDENGAQVAHEALLTAWPRLRDWIGANRDGLKLRHQISSAASTWHEAGRDDAMLLRGAPLLAASEWASDPDTKGDLNPLVREFISSAVLQEQARRAAAQRHLILQRLTAVLATMLLIAAGLTAYSFAQRHAATVARNQADSLALALQADQVRGQDPSLAAQLSLAAYRISPTAGALGSMLESASYPAGSRIKDSVAGVQSVAVAPDRRTLAVASADGTLRLWDIADPEHPRPLGPALPRLHGDPLYATAFSPTGHLLVAAGADRVAWVFNVTDPRHPVRLQRTLSGPASTIYSLAFSSDGKILAIGSADKTVRLWDMADPALPSPLGDPLTGPTSYVESVAISPDGHLLAAASADRTVRLWDISNPARPAPVGKPLSGPARTISSVVFSPGARTLAAGSYDHSVWMWNIHRPARPVRIRSPLLTATDWVNAVAFSPDGRTLAAASSDDTVRLWDASSGALLGTLPGPQPVSSLAWDGNHTLIAGSEDGMVRLWALPSPVLLNPGPANQVAYSPDGRLLAVASTSVRIWNAATRSLVATTTVGVTANSVAWAPSGNVLAAAYSDDTVRLWQVGTKGLRPLGRPLPASSRGIVEDVTFARDGHLLASTADDGTVRLWDVTDAARPKPLAVIHDSGTYVFSAAFNPTGKILAAASADNLTRLWDISDPARPRPVGGPLEGPAYYAYSVAFSPNGRILAVGSADKTVHLWNVANPAKPVSEGSPLTGPDGYVYAATFSPDGRTLAVSSTDGTVWLWNVTSPSGPTLITHMTSALSPTGHIYTVAFNPQGTTLASGSSDGSIRLWELRPHAAAQEICATTGQPLTRAEWRAHIPGRPYNPPCHD